MENKHHCPRRIVKSNDLAALSFELHLTRQRTIATHDPPGKLLLRHCHSPEKDADSRAKFEGAGDSHPPLHSGH